MIANSTYQSNANMSPPPAGSSYINDNPYTYQGGDENYETFGNISVPAKQTSADQYFQRGVDLFAAGNYAKASDYFEQAKRTAPSDVILPFAYVQSLFAEGKYTEAARQLRDTINRQPAGSEWAFYPRGLYLDDNVLMGQIDKLARQAGSDSDLQLLAGYQLLGIHQFDAAMDFLNKAQLGDKNNQIAVGKLMFILNNLKANYQSQNAGSENLSK
jgi:tetratricopeptide (TPR) repeat protein